MKKTLSLILTLCLILSFSFSSMAETPKAEKVRLSNQTITVNGETIPMDVYNIDGYNYFKLRDIAYILGGTGSQFSVSYDEETKSVVANSGEHYTIVGGEMALGTDKSKTCRVSTQAAIFNGTASNAYAYNIGGNNYFKLRDLGEEFGFVVDYDEETRTVIINSSDYSHEEEYISVSCTGLAERDTYLAYGYQLDYTGIGHTEIIGAKLDGRSIRFESLTDKELSYVGEQLRTYYDCGAYYYINTDALSKGSHTLEISMVLYHAGAYTGEEITISHSFTIPLYGGGLL